MFAATALRMAPAAKIGTVPAKGFFEQVGQAAAVGVGVHSDVRAREAAAVEEAGVILAVAEDDVARPDQRGNRAEIGGET